MPTSLDIKLRASALELIQRFGRPLMAVVPEKSRVDLTTGAAVVLDPRQHDITGFLSNYERDELGEQTQQADRAATILSTDVKAFLAAKDLPFTPTTGITIMLPAEGETFHVLSVKAYYSGAQVALWELQLRR